MKLFEEKFNNKEVIHLLRSIAASYLLKNENRFKIIAYEKAADVVEHLTRNLYDIWQEGGLGAVSGIGPSIASHLDQYFRTGRFSHFDQVTKDIPKTVFILMKIPTIGPKKAYKLVKNLKLFTEKTVIRDLKKACLSGKVAKLETFGEKSQADILKAIDIYEKRSIKEERMPLPYAFMVAKEMIDYLKKSSLIERVDVLGSLRRMVATIGDIDIVVQLKTHSEKIIDYFINFSRIIRIDNAGEKKASIIVSPHVRVDLRLCDQAIYGSMLQYFTGSKAHNIKLREYALKKGYSLSEYGIKRTQNLPRFNQSKIQNQKLRPEIYQFKNEKDLYNFLGLQYIPPELREGTDEIEIAEKKQIPKLIELKDIKGDLHLHSSYDLQPSHDLGENSYQEILTYGQKLGYQYIGFADHNPKISDLSAEEIITILKRRKEYISQVFDEKKLTINFFLGLEVDILPDGNLAIPEKAMEFVDYLIVSIHSSFNQEIPSMTKRVLRALSFPKVKILGHPTGRLLDRREGFELEWEKIFDFVKKKNIALEINAWPQRLDLPDTLVRGAIRDGAKLIINTDAHANKEMEGMFYGVAVARRGWAKKSDILNTLNYNNFSQWLLSKT